MIRSMTAFASHTDQGEWGSAVWELRSVNHRYLEVFMRLPDVLRDLEPALREQIRTKIQRGKVECFLKYLPQSSVPEKVSINENLVKQLAAAMTQITPHFLTIAPIDLMQVLIWPGVLEISEMNLDKIKKILLTAFIAALNDLVTNREKEGAGIAGILNKRIKIIAEQLVTIEQRLPAIMEIQRDKLRSRIVEAKVECDENRFEQEILLLTQKIDITEEVERMGIHINETLRTLEQGGTIGRRLDFLMQEINREANTLAAKSIDAQISSAAVEIRILVEQMREQIQNVE